MTTMTVAKKAIWTGVVAMMLVPSAAMAQAPTMAQTKAWFETDGAKLLGSSKESLRVGRVEVTYSNLTLQNCTLSYTHGSKEEKGYFAGRLETQQHKMFLKAVNLSSLSIIPATNEVGVAVRIEADGQYVAGSESGPKKEFRFITTFADDADRILKAVKRAAVLCGAKGSAFRPGLRPQLDTATIVARKDVVMFLTIEDGKLVLYRDDAAKLITNVEEADAIVTEAAERGIPLMRSSSLDFAEEYTSDPMTIALVNWMNMGPQEPQ